MDLLGYLAPVDDIRARGFNGRYFLARLFCLVVGRFVEIFIRFSLSIFCFNSFILFLHRVIRYNILNQILSE